MAESGFLIDGVQYEIPTLDSFTMAEAKILFECSGLALEDFAVDEDDAEATDNLRKHLRNPGFIEALMLVAYIRGNRAVPIGKAKTIIGQANLVEAINSMAEGDDALPPEPEKTESVKRDSEGNSASRSEPSGIASTNGLAEPGPIQNPTGISESAMSLPRVRHS